MKHKVTVETERTKHFLGIPYKVTEKEHLVVDGKTYREMKRKEKELYQHQAAAVEALFITEEEEEVDDEELY